MALSEANRIRLPARAHYFIRHILFVYGVQNRSVTICWTIFFDDDRKYLHPAKTKSAMSVVFTLRFNVLISEL